MSHIGSSVLKKLKYDLACDLKSVSSAFTIHCTMLLCPNHPLEIQSDYSAHWHTAKCRRVDSV